MLRGLVCFVLSMESSGLHPDRVFSLLRQALVSRLVQTDAWIPLTASSRFLVCRGLLLCLAPGRGRTEIEWPPGRWRGHRGIRASRLCKASQPETDLILLPAKLSSTDGGEEPKDLHQAVRPGAFFTGVRLLKATWQGWDALGFVLGFL